MEEPKDNYTIDSKYVTTYKEADNIGINSVEEESTITDDTNTESLQSPEYDKYRDLLNIFNEIELECVKFKNEYQLDTYSFIKWLSLIVEEVDTVSQELNNFALHNNGVHELRVKLIKLAATIVSWLEMMNGTNLQTSDNKDETNKKITLDAYRSVRLCPECVEYMFVSPKPFCNNLEHIRHIRS